MQNIHHPLALLACKGSEDFVKSISEQIPEISPIIIKKEIGEFPNGEISFELLQSVRGAKVFVVQTFIPGKINDMFMELILIADALRRAGTKEIHAVLRIYPYARQDRREKNKKNRHKRRPVSARVIADILKLKFDGVIAFDLHNEAIEGFFEGTLIENIVPFKIFHDHLEERGLIKKIYEKGKEPVLIGPDIGSSKKISDYAENLRLNYAIVDKKRINGEETEVKTVIGDVSDKDCVIIDDITATGSTLIGAKNAIKEKGAKNVIAMVTHLEIRTPAQIKKLAEAGFSEIVVTDSINLPEEIKDYPVFSVLPLAPMVSKVISSVYNLESLQPVVFKD